MRRLSYFEARMNKGRKGKATVKPIREAVDPGVEAELKRVGPVDREAEVKATAEMIYRSLSGMTAKLIEQANGGNVSAAKFLVEFAGIKIEMEEPEAREENAAEILVRMLNEHREECIREGPVVD